MKYIAYPYTKVVSENFTVVQAITVTRGSNTLVCCIYISACYCWGSGPHKIGLRRDAA